MGFMLFGKERVLRQLDAAAKLVEPPVALAMADWAEGVSAQQRALAPTRTGALRESTDWTFGNEAPVGAQLKVSSKRSQFAGHFLRVILFSGSIKAYWARWIEWGTKARAPGRYRDERGHKRDAGKTGHRSTRAFHYFWPVFEANVKHGLAMIKDASRKGLKQVEKVN
jgi:hypothetical protein